ncbi:ABC transporter permease [Paenibacillus pasadenensis]|uniref:ABC transporter permease n=1 Tax=Paenibacillus pasadenensis TaxID=217090 RepID=UPI00203A46E1|nr:ABC transporter permease [Paenibacillus pasadenensis]MCM3747035.1 ABC transporter permease [Paenibacillus pasadenensis]
MRLATFLVAIGMLLMSFSSVFSEAAVMAWQQSGGTIGPERFNLQAVSAPGQTGAAGYTAKEANKLIESWKGEAAYSIKGTFPVKAGSRQKEVETAGIGGNYSDFTSILLDRGSMITEASNERMDQVVVISDSLADYLFGSTDVLGKEIMIQNQKLRIIGVYSTENNLMDWMSRGVKPEVLLPSSVFAELSPESRVGTILLEASGDALLNGEMQVNKALLENKLTPGVYKIEIGEKGWRLMKQLPRLLPALTGVIILVLGLIWMRRIAGGTYGRMKRALKIGDSDEVMKRERLYMFRQILVFIAIGASTVALVLLARFSFFIPSEYIPDRWIDLNFFKTKLFEHWQEQPPLFSHILPYQLLEDRLGSYIPVVTAVGLLLGLPLFLLGIREWKRNALPLAKRFVRLFYCIAFCYLLLGLVMLLIGLPQFISPGLWISLFGFCLFFAAYQQPNREDDYVKH